MTARQAYENYLATSGASQWLSWEGWQAAYAAGMERAAEIAVDHYTVWDEGVTTGNEIAEAIRAEITKDPT